MKSKQTKMDPFLREIFFNLGKDFLDSTFDDSKLLHGDVSDFVVTLHMSLLSGQKSTGGLNSHHTAFSLQQRQMSDLISLFFKQIIKLIVVTLV